MQAGFCGKYAADAGLRPTAGFLRIYLSTHLPSYERIDSWARCWLVVNGSDQCMIRTRNIFNLVDS